MARMGNGRPPEDAAYAVLDDAIQERRRAAIRYCGIFFDARTM